MIQDIGEHVYNNAYRPLEADGESYVLAYRPGGALVDEDGNHLRLPTLRDWGIPAHDLFCRYLFSIDERPFFLAENSLAPLPQGFSFMPVSGFRHWRPRWLSFAGITGYQLYGWYRSNRYCGHCGSELGHVLSSREMACPTCGAVIYPKISPGIIVGITNGDDLLLTKYAGRGYTHWALVAGFAEIGESLEQTIRREAHEEVGLSLGRLRYYKSQPWSFTDTLLVGYFAEVEGSPTIHVDLDELSLGRWVSRAELLRSGRPEDASSLTNEMIWLFAQGKEPR